MLIDFRERGREERERERNIDVREKQQSVVSCIGWVVYPNQEMNPQSRHVP